MHSIWILPILIFFAHFHPKLAQDGSWDGFDEEPREGIENEEDWFRGESGSNEQRPRKPTQIQIFLPPRNRRPPSSPPQSPPQNRPPPPQSAPQPEPATNETEPTNELIAPADLTDEEKAARRRAYIQFLGQLEDAKRQLPGLQGRWGSRITENLVLLAQQQLEILNGDEQGPEEADKIFLGDGPLNLRQIQQGVSDNREDELQPVGRFNLDELGASKDMGDESTRFKRQQDQGLVSAVTCQEFVFDARQKWPQCAQVIGNVRDQSLCGDCWAVSASSAFSDRRCIQKVKQGQPIGDEDLFFSAYDTAICSDAATDKRDGCKGGSSAMAWRWYANTGVVSGGNNAQQNTSSGPQGGCKPYPFPPTAIADQGDYQALQSECFATCTNSEAANNNNPPRAKARSWNYLYGAKQWEEVMRNEIFENGSISASLMVFEDFKTYSSGVYNQVMGNQLGGHAIRLIGYGNITCSDGTAQKYWLGVNSWNTDWGLNGLFKIARGVDMCGIESRQIAYGIPIV